MIKREREREAAGTARSVTANVRFRVDLGVLSLLTRFAVHTLFKEMLDLVLMVGRNVILYLLGLLPRSGVTIVGQVEMSLCTLRRQYDHSDHTA